VEHYNDCFHKNKHKNMKYLVVLFLLLAPAAICAAETQNPHRLTLTIGGKTRVLEAAALLADPQTRDVTVQDDASYHKTMHYRAIPLRLLLKDMPLPPGSVIEAVAKDGFVAALPAGLVLQKQKNASEAFLAIEPPAQPWPPLAGKGESAGPFYVVWSHPQASGIRSEQWPFMVTALRTAPAPAKRWKGLAVDDALPAASPIRAGQALFVTQCMACHKLNGAGSADVGPDLNLPENPTAYFKTDALKKYIRDPASLRRWKAMQMPAFPKEALSDREIGLIVDYLTYMADRKTP
jgi:mono/diheme cytochrome c family protein